MNTTDVLKGWALVCRDLVDQGAIGASVVIPGGITLAYQHGKCMIVSAAVVQEITDAELDETGLVVAHEQVAA